MVLEGAIGSVSLGGLGWGAEGGVGEVSLRGREALIYYKHACRPEAFGPEVSVGLYVFSCEFQESSQHVVALARRCLRWK